MPEFRAAGVQAMIWRLLADGPAFDTANYHGIAERYWGLLHSNGSPKTAFRWFRGGPWDRRPHFSFLIFHFSMIGNGFSAGPDIT